MPRSAPPRARRAGQPGAGPGGSDVPFVTENEIPVRLSEFYDIFISWSHAGRRQPWNSGTPVGADGNLEQRAAPARSEEHTSELQSLMRISYAVFCLKKKKNKKHTK